jgi:UPF0755 protein
MSIEFQTAETNTSERVVRNSLYIFWLIPVVFLLLLVFFTWSLNQPTKFFPVNVPLTIEPGLVAEEVIDILAQKDYVRSSNLLYLILSTTYGAENVKSGTYVITEPLTTIQLAKLLTAPAPPSTTVTLTFPEGFSTKEYVKIAGAVLTNFDDKKFLQLSKTAEGKLFPDTYEVPQSFSAEELFALLSTTYEEKISPLRAQMTDNKLTEEGIINLASIVEREANTKESMQLVAGILDTRLVLGMPLQADATMEYVLNKPLKELTAEDLKIDTPYNTYLYKGLPPTPIGNPGLDSIQAVLNPKPSEYLFYITDENGDFHYAKTYDEHKRNIARYLR